MRLATHPLAIAAFLSVPHAAAACAQLSPNVWMCDRGTAWEGAEWDGAGDGTARYLGDLTLNFTEDFPGADIGADDSTLEEQYATYSEWVAADGMAPVEVLQSDTITTDHATVLRHLQRDRIEDQETMSAVMLAQVSQARMMLYLDAPASTSLSEIDALSREVAQMLRDNCADSVSCAEDYTPPGADSTN